jgi:hypothetical protein
VNAPELPHLTEAESKVIAAVLAQRPVAAGPDRLIPVRAEVLRRLVLGLELQPAGEDTPRVIPVPVSGLKLRYLHITDDSGDPAKPCDDTGILHLEDACGPNGAALPPLELEECLFPRTIHMSRARLRRLSLKGSFIPELCANTITIDGPLNISRVTSAEDHPAFRSLHPAGGKTGARYLDYQKLPSPPATTPADDAPAGPAPVETPTAAAAPGPAGIPQGRCWMRLTNATIGDDLEAASSCFVAPPERDTLETRRGSWYALDLTGSRIRGRTTFGPALHRAETGLSFNALGGISLARSETGHIWGCGAHLIAVEDAALDISGAHIQGHLQLDSHTAGDGISERFFTAGNVVLTCTRIDGRLAMTAAKITGGPDRRGALVASGIEIGNDCILTGTELTTVTNGAATKTFFNFYCYACVYLDDGTIRGSLYMSAADLRRNMQNYALFAPGLSVHGAAMLSVVTTTDLSYGFSAAGIVNFSGATFHRDLDMQGARLREYEGCSDSYSLIAHGVTIHGNLLFDAFLGRLEGVPAILISTAESRISLQNASIGDSLRMTSATLKGPGVQKGALDIAGANIVSDVLLNTRLGFRGETYGLARFEAEGPLLMQGTTIGGVLDLSGASIQASGVAYAINAAKSDLGSNVGMGAFEATHNEESFSYAFQAKGGVSFYAASMKTSLLMAKAEIDGTNSSLALNLTMCSVRYVQMDEAKLQGSVLAIDGSVSTGISANRLELHAGKLNLWGARLGHLSLNDLKLHQVPENGFFVDLGNAHIQGKFLISQSVDEAAGAAQPSEARPRLTADLRNLEVGELDDESGAGWGENTTLKLEGFKYQRMPRRKADLAKAPHRGFSGYLLDRVIALRKWLQAKTKIELGGAFAPLELTLIGVYDHFHLADAHIDWLNRQYERPAQPSKEEFTPSAYDQLARVLREEGHDSEAKKVLSAKFSAKRKVDVIPLGRPFWRMYHIFFDYGLSAFNAFVTFGLCIVFGWCAVAVANNSFTIGRWHHKALLVITTNAVNTVAFADNNNPDAPAQVGVQTSNQPPTPEIQCGKHRIDYPLYALEVFVPALDLNQTKLCEISSAPQYLPWRIGRALYAILGWIVTSITVLTVPGILRSRAEG